MDRSKCEELSLPNFEFEGPGAAYLNCERALYKGLSKELALEGHSGTPPFSGSKSLKPPRRIVFPIMMNKLP